MVGHQGLEPVPQLDRLGVGAAADDPIGLGQVAVGVAQHQVVHAGEEQDRCVVAVTRPGDQIRDGSVRRDVAGEVLVETAVAVEVAIGEVPEDAGHPGCVLGPVAPHGRHTTVRAQS